MPSTNKSNLMGQRFGRLIVLSENGRASNGSVMWLCQCDCGNTTTVRSGHLKNGDVQSCGCLRKEKQIKPIPVGEVFGRLTVIEQIPYTANFKCQCECGNIVIVQGKDLRRSHTQSCGCLKLETASNNGKKGIHDLIGQKFGRLTVIRQCTDKERYEVSPKAQGAYWICKCECGNIITAAGTHLVRGNVRSCGCLLHKDITGQRFGKLIALYRDNEFSANTKYRHSFWHCRCDCGREINVYLGHLQSGHTTSCGCDKSSRGELEINQLFDTYHIPYDHDKAVFKDLILPSGGIGRYDYVVYDSHHNIKYLIEFDGEQHYRDGWTSVDAVQQSDKIKNEYAWRNGYKLIRIPYWERGNITLSLIFNGLYETTAPNIEEAQEVLEEEP